MLFVCICFDSSCLYEVLSTKSLHIALFTVIEFSVHSVFINDMNFEIRLA